MHESLEARRDDLRRREGGFTLVELLVVIAVLAILTAVAVFAVGGIRDRGNSAACQATADGLRVAVEAYRAQEDEIPTMLQLTDGEWLIVDSGVDDAAGGLSTDDWNVGYNATTGAVDDSDCDDAVVVST